MTLTDGDVAVLAQQAADLAEPGLAVHVAPGANDDPYRWGSHGWTVTIGTGRRSHVWIPADATEDWVLDQIAERIRSDRPT